MRFAMVSQWSSGDTFRRSLGEAELALLVKRFARSGPHSFAASSEGALSASFASAWVGTNFSPTPLMQ